MRRLIIEEPVSRPALWSPRLAAFSLAVTLMSAGLLRFGWVDPASGLVALATGLGVAGLAILSSLAAFVMIWREGRRGLGGAVRGLLLAALILAWPAYHAVHALTLPPLTDISTDIDNPPSFSRSRAALEARDGRMPRICPPTRAGSSGRPMHGSRRSPSTSRRRKPINSCARPPPIRVGGSLRRPGPEGVWGTGGSTRWPAPSSCGCRTM
jgi:hypothetical protein